jgi:hypothetical protein
MDWQTITVVFLVAAAVAYLTRRTWRTWRGRAAGCGSCRCGNATAPSQSGIQGSDRALISHDELTARLRKRG